jgi:prepilin-type N-terminal cleavage/methylation domain-containing protein
MKRGFTLIELLVVIAIIGILSSIVLVSMGNVRGNARDVNRKSDMRQIISAQELYYNDNSRYLTSETLPTAIDSYLNPMPTDPGTGTYVWVDNTGDESRYCVYATLEDGSFFAVSQAGTAETTTTPTLAACGN